MIGSATILPLWRTDWTVRSHPAHAPRPLIPSSPVMLRRLAQIACTNSGLAEFGNRLSDAVWVALIGRHVSYRETHGTAAK